MDIGKIVSRVSLWRIKVNLVDLYVLLVIVPLFYLHKNKCLQKEFTNDMLIVEGVIGIIKG